MLHFNSTSNTLSAFVTTVYLLGWVCGPIVIAPLSELYGRAVLYKVCIVLFLLFNVACAVANSLASLIVFRLLAGIASSCPVTLGTGSIADMMPAEKRAGVMGAYVIGVVLGPTIGPIAGGYLTPALGWRWAFWLMAIIAAPLCPVVVIFMQESYPFVLLQRKTIRLRKETGNARLRSALDNGRTTHELFRATIFRPFKMLLMPIVFLLSLYTATVYSYLYLCFTTFPQVFGVQYGFGSGPSGLATLGLGVGSILGVLFCGGVSNKLSAYLTKKTGGEAKPEYRLPSIIIGGVCVPIGLFWYGWTADNKVHWILPIIGTGFLGAGMIITYVGYSSGPIVPRLLFVISNRCSDGHHFVSGRCIYCLCRLSYRVKHRLPLSLCNFFTTCRSCIIREAWSWLGNFTTWLCCCCFYSPSLLLLHVW